MKRPFCLIIMDGWGVNSRVEGNAVVQAKTPFLDRLTSVYPSTSLSASGLSVGLPEGQMGNSEVGHLNIGAGRIVYQDLTRISLSIANKEFFSNPALSYAMKSVRSNGTDLHLMGLLSDGGVHSEISHLFALIDMAKMNGIERLFIHAFLDGRDTPPRSGLSFINSTINYLQESRLGEIATVIGRYYAMDRDSRWDRISLAYDAMVHGRGMEASSPEEAIRNSYDRGEGDEFVRPVVIKRNGMPIGTIKSGDGVIFFNFRTDRTREISRALTQPDFNGFSRESVPELSTFVCLTEYDESLKLPVAFPPIRLANLLGEVISRHGLSQLRIAETEKYAHVTFFFNGGEEAPYPLESRILIPSPREVPTYDKKPDMSAFEVTKEVISCIENDKYDFIVLNFANADMVGHSGISDAAINACEAVDTCVGRVIDALIAHKGKAIITSDHGNAEQMVDYETGYPHTAHSSNPVPLILVDDERKGVRLREGILGDIAPTILEILNIPVPAEMQGRSLIIH